MKNFILWLEVDNKRLRKLLAIFTAIVWLISIITSFTISEQVTQSILTATTVQFSTVIGFYMTTKASE
jgi:hypothetical protein